MLSVLAAMALGILPTLSIAGRPFATLVHDGGRGSTAGRARHRLRRLLIVTQVAMALVLLVGSGLMLRSAARLHAVNPGFRIDGLVTTGVSLGTHTDRAQAVAFYYRVLDEMARIPGVAAAGAASNLPVGGTGLSGSSFAIRSRPRPQSGIPLFTMYSAVTEGYFETLGVPLLEGRAPARSDADRDLPVAWVSRTFARQFLDDRAVGEWIQIQERWLEIVGIVGDVKIFGLREDARPMVYLPPSNASVGLEVMNTVVRTSGVPASLASALRRAVDTVDASVALTTTRTMEDIVAASMAQTSFTMTLLAIAAGIALVLGVVGLYGVISYIVTQRTAEIGIRLALGAKPVGVCVMVLRQGLIVALAGVAVGLVAALALTRLMASLLFEVSAHDPATFGTVALVLTAVSAAATYLPARRAAGVDPVRALRQEG
jgi:putative ABC transport system permease protein